MSTHKEGEVILSGTTSLGFTGFENLDGTAALAFGFPCNDYSVVGEQKGMNGVYGPLYSYGVKVLNFIQTNVVFG